MERADTRVVKASALFFVNVGLAYGMIYGHFGLPALAAIYIWRWRRAVTDGDTHDLVVAEAASSLT